MFESLKMLFNSYIFPGKTFPSMKDFLNLTAAYLSSRTSEKNPNKFGIKVWMLADFKTYFVSRFQVYLGKQETDNNAGNDDEHGR